MHTQCIQSMGDYIKACLNENTLIVSETMKSIEKRLPSNFLRIHKSYIANVDHLEYAEGNQLKIGGKLIPIGTTYKEEVQRKLL